MGGRNVTRPGNIGTSAVSNSQLCMARSCMAGERFRYALLVNDPQPMNP